ncbi:hypothetical protein ACRE_063940 [Hapsidospora chrysogenum ATCC 11550]|uniref:Uncharacterized protein n=1 Tax=Hapsidospora chrysogenum (strain ATCC 11550 / CBS 779.69 / DSM 880 / IAM 14645 / JCM 23072 / IMI 49137) TaxID=857340 RepID=A0A086T0I0_HAPC1|nr:hypothetical protein ACRE_063940 [Hapsidospora chrysogenum ATCC 11550]
MSIFASGVHLIRIPDYSSITSPVKLNSVKKLLARASSVAAGSEELVLRVPLPHGYQFRVVMVQVVDEKCAGVVPMVLAERLAQLGGPCRYPTALETG